MDCARWGGDDRDPPEHAMIWIGNESWYPVSHHATREEAAAAWWAKPERVRLYLHIATVRVEE